MLAPSPPFFVGIPPPPELTARVLAWQAKLEHIITVPHVTLLAPAALPQKRWQSVAAAVAERQTAAPVTLGRVGFFGSRVIFLSVDAPALHELHRDLVSELGQAPGDFALENYHPHLTLALEWRSFNVTWEQAIESAQQEFSDLETQPLVFTASQLVLFGKDQAGQPYTERQRFDLKPT
ncbi:2'-5' RNA ligase family protein [Deinococcus detaillensis]|uniref:2'-5' RNA ligase family protein n=1 Tax=Deinococcus detaillensis TaxID=2592048 RepID=A0A553V6X8_9DEIO|nr:2'-5' RNA ligase family protein [Deinococcus detaillensis]TSA87951.1 2'-5' RNA ligase family protein [Deinococcus detaillensis]